MQPLIKTTGDNHTMTTGEKIVQMIQEKWNLDLKGAEAPQLAEDIDQLLK